MSGLNESEKLIIKFLQKNNSISNKEAAIITKFSQTQVRRIFTSLKKKELIIAILLEYILKITKAPGN